MHMSVLGRWNLSSAQKDTTTRGRGFTLTEAVLEKLQG